MLTLLSRMGLRGGEVGLLVVRESKFGKSRLIPLHATAVSALSD